MDDQITPEEIKELILKRGLTITDVIDEVVKINGFIGVGLISLGDGLKDYVYGKIDKHDQDYWG